MSSTIAILSARGAFYRVAVYENFSPAYYQIDELVASPTQSNLDLKDALSRQLDLQKNALDKVQGQTAVLKRVQTNLAQPDVLNSTPLFLEQHQYDLQKLSDDGVIDANTAAVLSHPIGADAPETPETILFNNAKEGDLPAAINANQAVERNISGQIQNSNLAITQTTSIAANTLDRSQILITGVQLGKRDVTSQVLCLNNAKVIYTFGQNFGDVAIRGEVLLGGVGDAQMAEQGIRTLEEWFESNRVSRSLMPVAVSIAARAFYVYLTGLVIQDIDEFHVMPFVMMGTLLDLSQKDLKNINPPGTVTSLTDSALDLPITTLEQALAKRKTLAPEPAASQAKAAANASAATAILPPKNTTTLSSAQMNDNSVAAVILRNALASQTVMNQVSQASAGATIPTHTVTDASFGHLHTLENQPAPAAGPTLTDQLMKVPAIGIFLGPFTSH